MKKNKIITPKDDMFKIFMSILDKINSIMKKPSYMKNDGFYYLSGLYAFASNPSMTPMTLYCNLELNMFNKKEQSKIEDFLSSDGKYFSDNYFKVFPIQLYQFIKEHKKEINEINFIEGKGIELLVKSSSLGIVASLLLAEDECNDCFIESYYNIEEDYSINIDDFKNISKILNYKGIMKLTLDGKKNKVFIDSNKEIKEYQTNVSLTTKILTGFQGIITASSVDTTSSIRIDVSKVFSKESNKIFKNLKVLDIVFLLNDKNGKTKRETLNRFLVVSI